MQLWNVTLLLQLKACSGHMTASAIWPHYCNSTLGAFIIKFHPNATQAHLICLPFHESAFDGVQSRETGPVNRSSTVNEHNWQQHKDTRLLMPSEEQHTSQLCIHCMGLHKRFRLADGLVRHTYSWNVQRERRGNTVDDFLKMQFVLKVSLKQSDRC